MSVRIGGSDGRSWWIPLGVEYGAVALALDEVQKRFDDFSFGQVPDQEAPVVTGAQEDVGVVGMRFQYESFALVTDQFLV